MKILYHCRGCGEQGEEDIEFNYVLKLYTNNKKLLDILIEIIEKKHTCSDPQIGIRSS